MTQRVIDAYRTCEFSTLGRDGTPMTWPTVVARRPDGTLLVTTSVGFPQKAYNIRRDSRVALLFSDPTASGVEDAPQVLVTGTATCPAEIVTTPEGIEDYWRTLFARQPSSRAYLGPVARRLTDWYFFRLLITITPTEVVSLPRISAADVRPNPTPASVLGADVIARVPTAVLGARDAEGRPLLTRTSAVPTENGYAVDVPPGLEVVPGSASLLVHRHGENLDGLMNALITGVLSARTGGGLLLTPHRVIEPTPNRTPMDVVRIVRGQRRAAKAYLDKRGLARPKVDWDRFKQVAA